MEKETVGFLGHLEFLLDSDDRGRWTAIGGIICLVGMAGAFDLVVANASVDDAVFLMGFLTLILSIAWGGWYCAVRPIQQLELLSISRRNIVLQGATSMVGLFVGFALMRLEARALSSDLLEAANSNDYQKATQVLQRAKTSSVHLDLAIFREASQKFVDAAPTQPTAWDAVMAGLNYQSYRTTPPAVNPEFVHTHYEMSSVVGHAPRVGHAGKVPIGEAARLEHVGKPTNSGPFGDRWVLLDGGGLSIDDMRIKNAILSDVAVYYIGGPLILENVYFRNCTFAFAPHPRTALLAQAILNSNTSVTLTLI